MMNPYASASGVRGIVSPTLEGMLELCEWARVSITQAIKDVPALINGQIRTWFQASQDFKTGKLRIELHWAIVCGGNE